MALYPAAKQKRLSKRFSGHTRMVAHNRVNLHVAVSLAASLHGYFNAPYRPSSHFYVRKSGVVEQYVDTAYRAEADGDGNDATISIETQGGLTNANGEPWTAAQVEALAKLYVWAIKTHGIKRKLATSSKLGLESKGLSWHRLGVDGNFGGGILRGRSQRGGGMHYSPSFGKICPGDAKIKQVPAIFERAEEILDGRPGKPVSNPKPGKKPKPKPKKSKKLKVDGKWGKTTTRRLQEVLDAPFVDGEVSRQNADWESSNPGLTTGWEWKRTGYGKGSQTIELLQKKIGVKADGLIGPATIKALQQHLAKVGAFDGMKDGELWKPSTTIEALQRRLNQGKV